MIFIYLKDLNSDGHQTKVSFSITKVYHPTWTQDFSNIETGHQGAAENFLETLMLNLRVGDSWLSQISSQFFFFLFWYALAPRQPHCTSNCNMSNNKNHGCLQGMKWYRFSNWRYIKKNRLKKPVCFPPCPGTWIKTHVQTGSHHKSRIIEAEKQTLFFKKKCNTVNIAPKL